MGKEEEDGGIVGAELIGGSTWCPHNRGQGFGFV